MRAINVLSLFDGISCGMETLNRLGIKVDEYYREDNSVKKARSKRLLQILNK